MADVFNLQAVLGLDSSGFTAGLNQAKGLLGGFSAILGSVIDMSVGFAKDIVQTGMGFDQGMQNVQAVLGQAEGTAENMATLRQFALDQASRSVFTAQEASEAYYYMGMAGWEYEQMLAGLPAVMSLAAASGESLARTSDIVTDSLTAFGLTADDAQWYADVLAQTATNANTNVGMMGNTFKYMAPVAGTMGMTIKDMAVSIGLIANSGIKDSMAGTALRTMLTRLATDAGGTSEKLSALEILVGKLGVDFYDAEGHVRAWGVVIREARDAWRGLDEAGRNSVFADFGSIVGSVAEPTEMIAAFVDEVKSAQSLLSQLNNTKDATEYHDLYTQIVDIGKAYEDLYEMLGLELPIAPTAEDYVELLDQARIKLGLMTDQEKIFYANQIGNLRGMSVWLALMNSKDEDFEHLTTQIDNAAGAAQRMADVKLDSLAGDVVYFDSALDILKQSIYNKVKVPMRDVVQFGTDAIRSINAAIDERGLKGGIEELGNQIEEAGKTFAPMLESIGKTAAPLVDGLIDTLIEKAPYAAVQLMDGLLDGMNEYLNQRSGGPGIVGMLTNILGGFVGATEAAWNPNKQLTIDGAEFTFNIKDIQAAIDKAQEEGETTVTINGVTFPSDFSAVDVMDVFISATDACVSEGFANAVANGEDIFGLGAQDAAGRYEDELTSVGETIGRELAEDINATLSGRPYWINVRANVTGLPNSTYRRNASAMSAGRIFSTPTIFGYAEGAYQIAGDAGPEAVVGTGSLASLIHSAVNSAMGSGVYTTPRNPAPRNIVVPLYLEGREVARAITPFIEQEQQRMGVKLVKGGVL